MSSRTHEAKMSFAQAKLPGETVVSLSLDGKFFLTAHFTPEQWEDFQSGRTAEVDTYHRNPID